VTKKPPTGAISDFTTAQLRRGAIRARCLVPFAYPGRSGDRLPAALRGAHTRCCLHPRRFASHRAWADPYAHGQSQSRRGGPRSLDPRSGTRHARSGRNRAAGFLGSRDMVWLDSHTLLIGHGYRTNRAGIEQMRALLAPMGSKCCRPRFRMGGPRRMPPPYVAYEHTE